jgi:hypothetical protein
MAVSQAFKIDKAFEDAGVDVDIVMSALDADVIKTYVELAWVLVLSMMWPMTLT